MEIIIFSPTNATDQSFLQIEKLVHSTFAIHFHYQQSNTNLQALSDFLQNQNNTTRNKFVLHGFDQLGINYPEMGKHFSRASSEQPLKLNQTQSKSVHHLSQLRKIKHFSHLFISPIFNSISKENHSPIYKEEIWSEEIKKHGIKNAFGLGGISTSTIPIISKNTYKGVAVKGQIWKNGDPIENFDQIKESLLHYHG